MNDYMNEACNIALHGIKHKKGGPFGAVIVKNGKIIAKASNTVLKDKDPTCHAEVNVIRKASKKLKSYDLCDCTLYTTSEPCPMCMSAIIWAGIKEIYFGTDRIDVEKIGFKDKKIYDYLIKEDDSLIKKTQIEKEKCICVLDEYDNVIY